MKRNAPVLSVLSVVNEYGPGHNSFISDEYGKTSHHAGCLDTYRGIKSFIRRYADVAVKAFGQEES
jgi:hypothetical protein